MNTVQQHREELVRFSRQLHQAGFVAATDGNLSVRLDNDRVLSTPTAMSKGSLCADDIVTVDMDGQSDLRTPQRDQRNRDAPDDL